MVQKKLEWRMKLQEKIGFFTKITVVRYRFLDR